MSANLHAAHVSRTAKYRNRAIWAMLNLLRAWWNNEPAAYDLLGWQLSDGCCSLRKWSLHFAPKDMQYYAYLKAVAVYYMAWSPCETTQYSKTSKIEVLQWTSVFLWPLAQILRRPELPNFLWQANNECKIRFLRMYDFGDGTRREKITGYIICGQANPNELLI